MTDTDAERDEAAYLERLAGARACAPLSFRRASPDPYARYEIRNERGELLAETCAGWPATQNEANARLFAAAPDLLNLVGRLTDMINEHYELADYHKPSDWTRLIDDARAVIAKARGEA
jgi:hypothetical protein